MAAVMALGIIIKGVLLNYFDSKLLHGTYGDILSLTVLALWVSFCFSFVLVLLNGKFREIHYNNPINRFGIGTWVAGTSICWILMYEHFIELALFVKIISYVNILFWSIYIGICIKSFIPISKAPLNEKVHGILLLPTVSTQSIVILLNTIYQDIPVFFNNFLILTGGGLYLISLCLIIKRYCTKFDSWSIEKDWNNTNCILHGALSITGLACIISQSASEQIIVTIWTSAMGIFLIVESIEFYRAFKRIRHYGWRKGIFVYDVSQWSRIFTFGMFYTFTFMFTPTSTLITAIRKGVILYGIWIILILAIAELLLCVTSFIRSNHLNKPTDAKTEKLQI